jgi:hypothetical protein
MSVVAFEKILQVQPGEAVGIVSNSPIPAGTTTLHPERPYLYDPTWGYVKRFGQNFGFQYDDAKAYGTMATFVIEGVFTINAESQSVEPDASWDDARRFNAMVAKYNALEQVFADAAEADAPADYAQWGTTNDPRAIPLPSPLVDKDGNAIVAHPLSLNVLPGQWTQKVEYRAVLREAKYSKRKVMVNGILLDNATVNINLPAPILFRKKLVQCAGELVQVQNYTCLEVEVSGKIPRRQSSQELVAEASRQVSQSMWADTVNVQVSDVDVVGGVPVDLFANMDVEGGNNFDAVAEQYQDVITVRMKAKL